jgi:hypothetical protein
MMEYIGESMASRNQNNTFYYNLFSLFEFAFYIFFFTFLFHNRLVKKINRLVLIFYIIITTINIFFVQGMYTFHTYTYILGCIIIVTFAIIYFYLLFRFPETGKLTRNPYFWIVAGLMFYHACSFSYMGLQNFITRTIQQYNWVLFFVQDILNVLLYTSFTIGFLCKISIRKSSALL